MKKSIFTLLIIIAFSTFFQCLNAQTTSYIRDTTIDVMIKNEWVDQPWAGGLNYCQISPIDLDQDGVKDLFIFDKSGFKITTWINEGITDSVRFVHSPEYRQQFPELHDWVLLRDYNCDGKQDIFTYSVAGFAVYRNDSNPLDGLQFTLVDPQVKSNFQPNFVNLFVSRTDIPAIGDIDGDTDLDVLTFDIFGSVVEYHRNLSMETYGTCDSLIFELRNRCWGFFSESWTSSSLNLFDTCQGNVPSPERPMIIDEPDSRVHAGSTLLDIDLNADGVKDLILGDVSSTRLVELINGGTVTSSSIVEQDTMFPSYDTPVDLPIHPAGYYLDMDNDGVRDLMVSPNDFASENHRSMWYYKNNGADDLPVFELQTTQLLQEDMIDVGEGAFPAFFDYNQDGLLDLFVGNHGYYTSAIKFTGQLAYFENVGTADEPAFEMKNKDFLSISDLEPTHVYPTFGDLDGDGDADLLIGEGSGDLVYFENTAGPGVEANFVLADSTYHDIVVGQFVTPQIVDVNRDGKNDLLIGERTGNVNYYENIGTATVPEYELKTDFFGEIDTRFAGEVVGHSAPFLHEEDGEYVLFSGSASGYIFRYENIDGNLEGAFTKTDSTFLDAWEGTRTSIAVTDMDDDTKPDYVIGNVGGGLTVFRDVQAVGINETPITTADFQLFPNPTTDIVTIRLEDRLASQIDQIVIYNMVGQEVLKLESLLGISTSVDVSALMPGVYHVGVLVNGRQVTKKLLKL